MSTSVFATKNSTVTIDEITSTLNAKFEDSNFTYEYHDYFKILPSINDWNLDKNRIQDGKKVSEGFTYSSDSNDEWMTVKELKGWIKNNNNKIGIS